MADTAMDGAWQCAFCGTAIILTETMVQVDGVPYCSPNCELSAQQPELARRARRGGGLVLTCHQCGTPIFLSELMRTEGPYTYCCPNCAEVARLKRQTGARQETLQPARP